MNIRLLLLSLLLGISFAATRLFIPVEFDEIDQPMINVTVRYVHFSVGRWFASDETRLVYVNNDMVSRIGNSFRDNQISRVLLFSVEEQSSRIGMVLENDDSVIRFQDHDEVMQMNYIGVGRLSQIFQRFESITLLRYSDEDQFGSLIFGGSLDFFRDHHCGASSLISIPLTSFDTFTGHIGTDDARDRLPPRITFQINSLDNKIFSLMFLLVSLHFWRFESLIWVPKLFPLIIWGKAMNDPCLAIVHNLLCANICHPSNYI